MERTVTAGCTMLAASSATAQTTADGPQGTRPDSAERDSGQVGQQCRKTAAMAGGVSRSSRSRDISSVPEILRGWVVRVSMSLV